MSPTTRYRIVFRRAVEEQVKFFKRNQIVEIRDAIEKHLEHDPTQKPRNRKPLEENKGRYEDCEWELRCGHGNRIRVFYRVEEYKQTVIIIAIGVKIGNQLFIGGEEFP